MRDGRILIVAGESSGDLHAAGVVAELRRRAPDLTIEGIGGERMRRAGVRLHAHAGDLAVVGLVEVAGRLPAIWRAYRSMIRCLRDRRPDLVILVDFPDFNLSSLAVHSDWAFRWSTLSVRRYGRGVPAGYERLPGMSDGFWLSFPLRKVSIETGGLRRRMSDTRSWID